MKRNLSGNIFSWVALPALLLASCVSPPTGVTQDPAKPAPAVVATVPPVVTTDPGVVLIGKVVTMNDAGDVLPGARVWLRGGMIEALVKAGETLPAAAANAPCHRDRPA